MKNRLMAVAKLEHAVYARKRPTQTHERHQRAESLMAPGQKASRSEDRDVRSRVNQKLIRGHGREATG
jgi:hypothetical protein